LTREEKIMCKTTTLCYACGCVISQHAQKCSYKIGERDVLSECSDARSQVLSVPQKCSHCVEVERMHAVFKRVYSAGRK
jgi:hypothetical protein